MARPEQMGIKWWFYCQVCEWAANTQNNDNDNVKCPNCNNPVLSVKIDEEVFAGRRYDLPVRSSKGQEIADAARAAAGKPHAPPDVTNEANQGHDYGSGDPPFPP